MQYTCEQAAGPVRREVALQRASCKRRHSGGGPAHASTLCAPGFVRGASVGSEYGHEWGAWKGRWVANGGCRATDTHGSDGCCSTATRRAARAAGYKLMQVRVMGAAARPPGEQRKLQRGLRAPRPAPRSNPSTAPHTAALVPSLPPFRHLLCHIRKRRAHPMSTHMLSWCPPFPPFDIP